MSSSFISYYRVSTTEQETSGLGMMAQRQSVLSFISGKGDLISEYTETESGKLDKRIQINNAIRHCKVTGATLVIAKLDRLSRNAAFLLNLQSSNITFVCCDMPFADKLTIGVMALLAEKERDLISERTRAALAIRKAQGVLMGGRAHNKGGFKPQARIRATEVRRERALQYSEVMLTYLSEWLKEGKNKYQIASLLNEKGFLTPRGVSGRWHITQVTRLLSKIR